MKKTLISLAAASLVASTAFAADKGIDIDVGGQAVVYYETHNGDGSSEGMLDDSNSVASVGVQLDLGADLGNNFTFGSQLTYLGTSGLQYQLVNGVKQAGGTTLQGSTTDDIALTKIFIAKQIGNTTLKIGRQELPKSLSPLAFSEGWNVYKNTFDAIVAINTDIPKTTLVGAYVSGGTSMTLGTTAALPSVAGEAYMITAATTVIPMTTVTATYYKLNNVLGANTFAVGGAPVNPEGGVNADAYFLSAAIKPMDMLNIGLQAGIIDPDGSVQPYTNNVGAWIAGAANAVDDTMATGVKIAVTPMDALSLSVAYTSVNAPATGKIAVAMINTGTDTKTPLFTQMVYNQNAIALDADTIVAKVSYNLGDMGSITVQHGQTKGGKENMMAGNQLTALAPIVFNRNGINYQETDVIYKVKAGGVQYFAAYVNHSISDGGAMNSTTAGGLGIGDTDNIVRVWARYNF